MKSNKKKLYIVKYHGFAYVMADIESGEDPIEIANNSRQQVDAWTTKATGCYQKFRNKIPSGEENGRTCAEILSDEGYKLK